MITRKQFLAIIAAPFVCFKVKNETRMEISDMPYKNMGIIFSKGHSKKRVSLEWADGIKFSKVKAVDNPNGNYTLYEP